MSDLWLSDDYNLNDVVMGVAGFALGMRVRLSPRQRRVDYGYDGRHVFSTYGMRFPIDSPAAIEDANDKVSSRMQMAAAGVRTVPFTIVDGANPLPPVPEQDCTLKGAHGKQGRGVVTRIPLPRLAEVATHLARSCRALLLEPTLTGPTYRLLVLDSEVIDAFLTFPPRLVGDGQKTVRELFSAYADGSAQGYGIRPVLDFEVRHSLANAGLREDDVVAAGREFQPTALSNISRGGGWIRLEVGPTLAEHCAIARKAAGAVGLRLCGVDLIESGSGEVFVLEANPSPGVARFTWAWRPDFSVDSLDLSSPIGILQAVLRSSDRPPPTRAPDFVRLSVEEFNAQATRLIAAREPPHPSRG